MTTSDRLASAPPEPPRDCVRCPRLVELRHLCQRDEPDWFNAPVPSFGPDTARLLVLGMAPGRGGANRTGRPFTGDGAGDVLYPALLRAGLARGAYAARPDDGLELRGVMITNVVRCLPPENKPSAEEVSNCRPFLWSRLHALPELRAVMTLGKIAHEGLIRALGLKLKDYPFGHGRHYALSHHPWIGLRIHACFHCSRYNMNTGRLTEEMFDEVLGHARRSADL